MRGVREREGEGNVAGPLPSPVCRMKTTHDQVAGEKHEILKLTSFDKTMLPSQGSLRECISSGESKIRVLNSGYIFLLRITARRISFRQVSLTGIVFWELSCHLRLFLTVRP